MVAREGRRKKTDLIFEVLNEIRASGKTIGEIANCLNTNWDSVKDAITFLVKIGHVKEDVSGSDKKYMALKYGKDNSKIPTYFKLPIGENIEKFSGYIFYKITELFVHKNGVIPTSTQLQKIGVDIFDNDITRKIVQVPTGWYRFGKISIFGVRQGDNFDEYKNQELDNNIDLQNVISQSVKKFSDVKNTNELRKQQYENENKIQYLTLLELQDLFNQDLDQNKDIILNKLEIFISFIPEKSETEGVKRMFFEFKYLLLGLINQNKNLNDFSALIYDIFSGLWDALATYNFYESLLLKNYYEKEILDENIYADVWLKQFTSQACLEELKQKSSATSN